MIFANNDYNSSLADNGSDGMGFHANGLTVGWWSFKVFQNGTAISAGENGIKPAPRPSPPGTSLVL